MFSVTSQGGGGGVKSISLKLILMNFIVFSTVDVFTRELTAVSTDAAKTIRVCRVGPVRRFVSPPLCGSTAVALPLILVSGVRQ